MNPSALVMTHETLIMWIHNQTSKWLDQLIENDKEHMMKDARANVKKLNEQHKKRQQRVLRQHKEKLLEKQHQKQEKERRALAEHLRLTNEVSKYGGVWARKSDVDKNLNKIRENKKKKEALSTKIKYHSSVLRSKAPSKLHFNKATTVEGKYIQFDIDTLKKHLKEIIDFNEFTSAIDFEEDVVEHGFLTYREEHK